MSNAPLSDNELPAATDPLPEEEPSWLERLLARFGLGEEPDLREVIEDALVLTMMRYQDELADISDLTLPSASGLRKPELAMARQLIDHLSGSWDPSKYTDEYRANLMKLIRAKMQGKKLKGPRTTKSAGEDDKVVDLMSRLRQSLAEGKPRKPAHPPRARKKTAARSSRARKSA